MKEDSQQPTASPPGSRLLARLRSWFISNEEKMAQLLANLVAVPTENPPGRNYRECAALLEEAIRASGLTCERIQVPTEELKGAETRVALFATHGTRGQTLHFHGHYDVVPGQAAEQFVPRREGNFLFGRGACDMKGGIVAMLYAIRALKECGVELNGRICLTTVPDEETGGALGSAWLARKGWLGRDGIGMLTAEPTSGVIWNANRGAITLRVRVLGKSAHVGLQHQGQNAFERMHRVVEELLVLKGEVEKRSTAFKIVPDAARHSILMLGGQSGGGTNFNVVPDECWFTVDRRINPEEDLATEKARLFELFERLKREGVPLEVEILQEGQAAGCSEDGKLGRALARSIEEAAGQRPQFEMCPGLLETRFYAAQGIPAYAYGPGLLSVAHSPKEYVDLRKVAECALVYALTAVEIFRADGK